MSNDKARTLIRSCELKLKEVFQKLSSGFEKHVISKVISFRYIKICNKILKWEENLTYKKSCYCDYLIFKFINSSWNYLS